MKLMPQGFLRLTAVSWALAVPVLLAEGQADRIIAAAREAARVDRNAESAALFEKAIRESPSRRLELLRELADQLTYSNRASEAVPLYREVLAQAHLSTDDVRDAHLGLGLALGWSGNLDGSLAEYDIVLAGSPRDDYARRERSQRIVEAARKAAGEDRNVEAAALFGRAVRDLPERRHDLLCEWAEQLTYSGRSAQAVPLFREVLDVKPGKDEARRARLGLALALSWSGNKRDALAEYEALIQADGKDVPAHLGRARVLSWMDKLGPARKEYELALRLDRTNREAAKGLARVQSWRGRQRDAQRRLGDFVAGNPGDAEAVLLLAQSEQWMGRPDRAAKAVGSLLDQNANNEDASRRLNDLERGTRPRSTTDFRRSVQSDDLTITRSSARQDFRLGSPLTTLGMTYESYRYDPATGAGITVSRPGAMLAHRFSDNLELHMNGFLDRIHGTNAGSEHVLPTFDTWLTLWSGDALRFDFGANRTTFDNLKSLGQGIAGNFGTFSMDLMPSERSVLSTRFNFGGYTDGNRRGWGQVDFQQRVLTHPGITVGARYTAFGFTRTLDNGYFNPSRYQSAAATAHVVGHLGKKLYYDLDGSAGQEYSTPGGRKPLTTESAHLRYHLSESLELEGRFEHFSSRQYSSSGFSRRTVLVALNYRW